MGRGTPLAQIRDMVKGEIGFNQAVGTASDREINTLISNKQKWLSSKWDWPFLETRYNVTATPGLRYVNVPNANFDRPATVERFWSNLWDDVDYGIGSEEFNYLNSDQGVAQDPVLRWTFAGQLEIPAPLTAPTLVGQAGSKTGVYQYVVTFETGFGETLQGPSSSITLTTQDVQLSAIPVGPSGVVENVAFPEVVARNVYRTKANGTVLFLLTTISDNTTTTFLDTALDNSLGTQQPPTNSNAEATVMEIWPIPVSAQTVRFTMQRLLNPLIADTDTADLDDIMLTLFVAAEMLQRRKQEDAQLKLTMANAQLYSVRANYPRRTRKVLLNGRREGDYNKVVPMSIIAVHG